MRNVQLSEASWLHECYRKINENRMVFMALYRHENVFVMLWWSLTVKQWHIIILKDTLIWLNKRISFCTTVCHLTLEIKMEGKMIILYFLNLSPQIWRFVTNFLVSFLFPTQCNDRQGQDLWPFTFKFEHVYRKNQNEVKAEWG